MVLIGDHILVAHPKPGNERNYCRYRNQTVRRTSEPERHSLALVPAVADFVVEIHFDLQDELQLLVGDEGGQRAVDLLAGFHSLPVVLAPQVHLVAAGRLLVVVPPAGAFLCGGGGVVSAASSAKGTTKQRCGAYC